MKKVIALLMVLAMVVAFAACKKAEAPAATPAPTATPVPREAREPIAKEEITVGVILVHDENSGYDMAHIDGVKGACEAVGIPMDHVIMKYNIPEDEKCYDTAIDLVEQGCDIIFSDSYSHQSFMMQAAKENADVMFVACTGDTASTEPVPNVVNIFPYTFESRYLSGIVAGMKLKELMDAGTVTDPYLGYVGAYPYAEVVSGYSAFFIGARSIVPDAHMDVQFTNSWYDPTAEAEAANALISKGCVIISQHADSTGAPSAIQAALDGGKNVYSVGYNIDMLSVAPTAALTSAQNNWVALYQPVLEKMVSGEVMPADISVGAGHNAIMISPLGPSCAAGTQEAVDKAMADIKAGTLHVFDTKSFTVGGAEVTTFAPFDVNGDFVGDVGEAIWDGYFHESELRSAPYFALDIDGITKLN